MCDIICVTNRKLCKGDFLLQLEKIAVGGISAIVLREKDLSENEYEELAEKVIKICEKHDCRCILHSFSDAAVSLGADKIHLPLHLLETLSDEQKRSFSVIGASCHSVEDAAKAEKLGCTYITAGHIFATDCKKDLAPRGIDFLKAVCERASVPVYAIGGISEEHVAEVIRAGAAGVCVMSGLMQCQNPEQYIERLKKAAE